MKVYKGWMSFANKEVKDKIVGLCRINVKGTNFDGTFIVEVPGETFHILDTFWGEVLWGLTIID